jgi:hypothetical protein
MTTSTCSTSSVSPRNDQALKKTADDLRGHLRGVRDVLDLDGRGGRRVGAGDGGVVHTLINMGERGCPATGWPAISPWR